MFLLLFLSLQANALTGYAYRRILTIQNTGTLNLLNSQVRVWLNSLNHDFSHALSTGADIRFTLTDSTTLLTYWWEKYDATNHVGVAWVKMPSVATSATVTLVVWYGKASAPAVSSFDNTMQKAVGSVATYHFDEGSGTTSAEASSGPTATLVNSTGWGSGDGGNFRRASPRQAFATGSYLNYTSISHSAQMTGLLSTVPANGTINLWMKMNGSQLSSAPRILVSVNNTTPLEFLDVYVQSGIINIHKTKAGTQKTLLSVSTYFGAATNWFMLTITWGAGGFTLYINGAREAYDSDTNSWGNGSERPFFLGNGIENTLGMNAQMDDFTVYNTQLSFGEINALFNRAKYSGLPSQIDLLVDNPTNPLFPISPETDAGEPSILYESGTYKLWYGIEPSTKINYATSSNGTTWTPNAGNPNAGNGIGGATTNVYRNFIYKEGSTYYMYYVTSQNVGSVMRVLVSTDGIAWADHGSVVLSYSSYSNGIANMCVWKEGSTYYCVFDNHTTAPNWEMSWASGSTPFAFTDQRTSTLSSLQLQSPGCFGGAFVVKISGVYHIWYEASDVDIQPNSLTHAVSTDLNNWVIDASPPVIAIGSRNFEYDQAADATIVEANGKVWMYYSGNDNRGTVHAWISLKTYTGTLAQLTSPVPMTFGSEQAYTAPVTYYKSSTGGKYKNSSGKFISF